MNRSAYLESVLVFEVLTSVFTWSHEVFDPNWPLLCPVAEPLPLMELCRRAARQALGRHRIHHIQSLPLPQTLKNYLQYQWDTHSQKTHLRSLDTCSEMICAAGDFRTVEALCCAQMLMECRKDRRYRIEQPDDKYLIFIHDYEVIVTIRCLCLRMTHVFHNFLKSWWFWFLFTFISKLRV